MHPIMFRYDDRAARILVEPVDDSRSLLSTDSGKIAAVCQNSVHQGSRAVPGPGMHRNPTAFVDNKKVSILEEDLEFHRLGHELTGRRNGDCQLDELPRA